MGKDKDYIILRKHFKSLCDYLGMEWTSDSDIDLERLINGTEALIKEKINEAVNMRRKV